MARLARFAFALAEKNNKSSMIELSSDDISTPWSEVGPTYRQMHLSPSPIWECVIQNPERRAKEASCQLLNIRAEALASHKEFSLLFENLPFGWQLAIAWHRMAWRAGSKFSEDSIVQRQDFLASIGGSLCSWGDLP